MEMRKITKSTADMVLLNNDYSKLPAIFHEGNNLIFNLRLSTEFLGEIIFAVLTVCIYIFNENFPNTSFVDSIV